MRSIKKIIALSTLILAGATSFMYHNIDAGRGRGRGGARRHGGGHRGGHRGRGGFRGRRGHRGHRGGRRGHIGRRGLRGRRGFRGHHRRRHHRRGHIGFGLGFGRRHYGYYGRPYYGGRYYDSGYYDSGHSDYKDNQGERFWEVSNSTGHRITLFAGRDRITLQPGHGTRLYRRGTFVFTVLDEDNNKEKTFETNNHVVDIYKGWTGNIKMRSWTEWPGKGYHFRRGFGLSVQI